jgi:hypothetical protein
LRKAGRAPDVPDLWLKLPQRTRSVSSLNHGQGSSGSTLDNFLSPE